MRLFRRTPTPNMSPAEAAAEHERGALVIVDVRQPREWRAGHVRGSVHVPLSELPGRLSELAGDRPLAFLCASGARSARATRLATRRGVEAANVRGGLNAWRAGGLPVTAAER